MKDYWGNEVFISKLQISKSLRHYSVIFACVQTSSSESIVNAFMLLRTLKLWTTILFISLGERTLKVNTDQQKLKSLWNFYDILREDENTKLINRLVDLMSLQLTTFCSIKIHNFYSIKFDLNWSWNICLNIWIWFFVTVTKYFGSIFEINWSL